MQSNIVRADHARSSVLAKATRWQAKYLVPVLLLAVAPAAQAVDYTWLGGSGNWTDANWSVGGFPNAASSNVSIDGGNPLNSVVNLNTSASVGNLGIGAGDTLNVLNGKPLGVSGTITNNGTLTVQSGTHLFLNTATTLTGSGNTVFSGGSIIGNTSIAPLALTIGADHTVRGNGTFGLGIPEKIFVMNQGTLLAEHGTLRFSTSMNSTGTLAVAADGVLQQFADSVAAQTINVAAGGSYELIDVAVPKRNPRLEANMFNGNFVQSAGTFAAGIGTSASTLSGNYTLNTGGTFELDLAGHAAGSFDQLQVGGNLSLAGALAVAPQAGFTVAAGDVFNFLKVGGSRSGTFAGLAEGAAVPVGGSNLFITYAAGAGKDIALVSPLTAGSVGFAAAGAGDVAYFVGTRPAPTGGTPSPITLRGLDLLAGSSFTLGVDETLNLNGGTGTLNVGQGAVFSGNGIVQGNIHNSGLVRVPFTGLPHVSGGNVVIPAPTPTPGNPTPPIVSPIPVPTLPGGTRVEIGGSSGGGGFGGGGGPSGPGGPTPTPGIITVDPCGTLVGGCGISNPAALHAVDASLEVTGFYTQDAAGITRMFVAGNDAANFGPSRSGGSYSQLFVHDRITLDGTVQVVLQPEWFTGFSYAPHIGDTFDFFISDVGIDWLSTLTFKTFVTAEGAGLLDWLITSPYSSGILSDPDHLLSVSNHLFDFSLVNVNGQFILRGTLVAWGASASSVPEPSMLWLIGAGLLGFAGFGRHNKALGLG